MSEDQAYGKRRRRQLMAIAALGLSIMGLVSGATSMAVFTDTETTNATFTSGTIILDATKIDALSFSSGSMVPGDNKTGAVVVENDGDQQLRYSLMATSADDSSPNGAALFTVLTVEVKEVDATTPGTPCDDFDGTNVLSETTLGASLAVFGNPAPTDGTGDRTVNAAANETLCMRIALPISVGNTFQGAASTTTFTFNAEQTANN